jgi:hypothetical protein
LPDQRSRHLLHVFQHGADPAQLRPTRRCHDDARTLSGRYQRAGIEEAAAIAERRFVRDCGGRLFDDRRFPRQDRFVDEQALGADHAKVRRDFIAGCQGDEVALHQVLGRDLDAFSLADRGRAQGQQVANGVERLFGLPLLNEADDGVDDDGGEQAPRRRSSGSAGPRRAADPSIM